MDAAVAAGFVSVAFFFCACIVTIEQNDKITRRILVMVLFFEEIQDKKITVSL